VSLLDLVIAVFCIGFALSGLLKGLVRQASSWIGLILGHLAGVKYFATAQQYLKLDFPRAETAAYVIVFVVVYLAVRFAGGFLEQRVRASKLSGTDRLAGGLAGFLKGLLLSILLVFVLVVFLPKDGSFLKSSKLAPKVVVAARWMSPLFPEKVRASFNEKFR
jgi:uncharacterized membrane protein required for colicin V production